MGKIYLVIGMATFWGVICGIIIGIISTIVSEILSCLRFRKDIISQIETGKFLKHKVEGYLSWFNNESQYNIDLYDEVDWKEYYHYKDRSLFDKLFLIGIK